MVAGVLGLRRRTSRAVRVTLLLLLVYMACWTPYSLGSLWRVMDGASYARFENVLSAIGSLVVTTVLINPFIYGRFERAASRQPQSRLCALMMFTRCL